MCNFKDTFQVHYLAVLSLFLAQQEIGGQILTSELLYRVLVLFNLSNSCYMDWLKRLEKSYRGAFPITVITKK